LSGAVLDVKGFSNDRIHRLVSLAELFQIGSNHSELAGQGNLPDVERELAAAHSRHEVIQNRQIKGLTLQQLNCLRAFGSFDNMVPINGEQQFERLTSPQLILDQEYPLPQRFFCVLP